MRIFSPFLFMTLCRSLYHTCFIPSVSLFLFFSISACSEAPQEETIVYSNTFESNDLSGISDGKVVTYQQNRGLGRYNNDGFILNLSSLPKHDMVEVSFDLYIHDSWDGNDITENGPDIWQMRVDGELFINTTFSNCNFGLCLPQSYPLSFLNNKNAARTGATRTNLPGVCLLSGNSGTSLYKISKKIRHSGGQFKLQCLDRLIEEKSFDRLCDESWSADNIVVKLISVD